MCDDGRFDWKYIHSEHRIRMPEMRDQGKPVSRDWDTVLSGLRKSLFEAAAAAPHKIAAVLSPWMTIEEAYLLASYIKGMAPSATLAMGPVRVVGEDDTYPKDIHGRPAENVKFTIRAEKCPNRRGVELVLEHFAGGVVSFNDVLARTAAGDFDAIYLVGGDPRGWIDEQQAECLSKCKLVVVQDLLPSPALAHATFILAGGSFAEREGTFVNHAGLAEEIHKSIRSPDDARPDGRILWDLAQRRGLFRTAPIRQEIAATVPGWKALKFQSLEQQIIPLDEKVPAVSPAVTPREHG
jgi:NADH-quinone oxidoreductase subunit G